MAAGRRLGNLQLDRTYKSISWKGRFFIGCRDGWSGEELESVGVLTVAAG